jgi:ergothioneine biosynthesis protein EgtB
MNRQQLLLQRFNTVRNDSEILARPIWNEDYSVQPEVFVSPPKWHLAHTTWFWEQFVLTQFKRAYQVYDDNFGYLFNSYYNNAGKRVSRPERGLMTRPSVSEVYQYRAYVDEQMRKLLLEELQQDALGVIEIGLNHEEQHQELFVYDIKYILGHQPAFPVYGSGFQLQPIARSPGFHRFPEGIYEIGHHGDSFCFDNELGRHKVYLVEFEIAEDPVTNAEYLEFMRAGGYTNFNLWHDSGWDWKNINNINAPLYWHQIGDEWHVYDLDGLRPVELQHPVRHLSFYEAFAFAEWSGLRLPTEFEWEAAAEKLDYGQVWEWTGSAYLPYPHYKKAPGALGEYNGKFMVNQMVLRGASVATPAGHSRITYRNFFHPDMRWQYCGLRLAK